MFERYTERARRVLFFGRYEASQLGSSSIDTEHVLLGLLREGKGITHRIFADARMSTEDVRIEVEKGMTFHEQVPTSVEIPFTPECKRVLQFAAEEADRLLHNYIGTEHLLLGILREESSRAAKILTARGLQIGSVRDQIVALLQEHGAQEPPWPPLGFRGVASERPRVSPAAVPQLQIVPAVRPEAGRSSSGSPTSWVAHGFSLSDLVAHVHEVSEARIAWPDGFDATRRFDCTVALSEPSPDRLHEIVRLGLEALFDVVIRREPRRVDAYVLSRRPGAMISVPELSGIGGGGVGAISMGSFGPFGGGAAAVDGSIHCGGTIADLCRSLEFFAGRVFVDETGLTASYEFNLRGRAGNLDEFLRVLVGGVGLNISLEPRDIEMIVVRRR